MFGCGRHGKTPALGGGPLEGASEAQTGRCYQCADVVRLPAGSRWGLVYSRSSRAVKVLPRHVAELLAHCQSFETIEQHTASYLRHIEAARNPWDAQSSPLLSRMMSLQLALASQHRDLRGELSKLVEDGLLTSDADLARWCKLCAGNDEVPTPISSIVIPTRDRPESLERTLTSYAERCRHFGRKVGFVVVDLSEGCDGRERNRRLARSLKARYGAEVSYADRARVAEYASRLTEAGDFPPEVVNFCLFNPPQWGIPSHPNLKFCNYGACSNALLLHSVGEIILQVDDDTVCRIGRPPETRGGLALSSSADVAEFWFFPDRGAALKSVACQEEDLVAVHEKFLGAGVEKCVAAVSENDLDLKTIRAPFVRRILNGGARVRVTWAGVVGDSGLGSPLGYLLLRGDSWRRLTKSQPEYLHAITGRAVLCAVARTTISDGLPGFLCNAGLDNRALLPPFPPVQRNHDGVFMDVLANCFNGACFASLPWVLFHDPLEARAFSLSDLWDAASGFRSGDLLRRLVADFSPAPAADGAERLRSLGRYLTEIGSLSPKGFEELLQLRALHTASTLLSAIDMRLRESVGAPEFWTADLEKAAEVIARELASERYSLPRDLRDGCAPDESREVFRRLVYMFGRLLCCWPDMVAAAKDLRVRGWRLACDP
ncbi:MAG TPA: hypothetical protein VFZ08_13770 [Terriglobia bacterium]|nr:hypothetical protein [Terriglobia bacterium]